MLEKFIASAMSVKVKFSLRSKSINRDGVLCKNSLNQKLRKTGDKNE